MSWQTTQILSFVAGNFGGITRDLLIGAVPPAAISDWRYLAVSIPAGAVTFGWFTGVNRLQSAVLLFDAAGLALFAVSGTQKALAFGRRIRGGRLATEYAERPKPMMSAHTTKKTLPSLVRAGSDSCLAAASTSYVDLALHDRLNRRRIDRRR
jgi:Glycine transporter